MSLTVEELETHVETDLDSSALQRLIDDAEASIVERAGALAGHVDQLDGDVSTIFLHHKAASITAVVERSSANVETTLAADDYRLTVNGWALERMRDGTNPASRWDRHVTITYSLPTEGEETRKRVAIDLVKLALRYTAVQAERSGNYNVSSLMGIGGESAGAYERERRSILDGLGGRSRLLA